MSKVKVSKEVFDALEFYSRNGDDWKDQMLKNVMNCKDGLIGNFRVNIISDAYSVFELAELLVNGYEVEITPLEELECTYKDLFRSYLIYAKLNDKSNMDYYSGYIEGIKKTVNIMNLDIDLKL